MNFLSSSPRIFNSSICMRSLLTGSMTLLMKVHIHLGVGNIQSDNGKLFINFFVHVEKTFQKSPVLVQARTTMFTELSPRLDNAIK